MTASALANLWHAVAASWLVAVISKDPHPNAVAAGSPGCQWPASMVPGQHGEYLIRGYRAQAGA